MRSPKTKMFWLELVCRIIGHSPDVDPFDYPYCKRCRETLLVEGQRRPF